MASRISLPGAAVQSPKVSTPDRDADPFLLLRTLGTEQAALMGILSRLNGLGLRLLSVEHHCVEEKRSSDNPKKKAFEL
jgi:hypothetical protein